MAYTPSPSGTQAPHSSGLLSRSQSTELSHAEPTRRRSLASDAGDYAEFRRSVASLRLRNQSLGASDADSRASTVAPDPQTAFDFAMASYFPDIEKGSEAGSHPDGKQPYTIVFRELPEPPGSPIEATRSVGRGTTRASGGGFGRKGDEDEEDEEEEEDGEEDGEEDEDRAPASRLAPTSPASTRSHSRTKGQTKRRTRPGYKPLWDPALTRSSMSEFKVLSEFRAALMAPKPSQLRAREEQRKRTLSNSGLPTKTQSESKVEPEEVKPVPSKSDTRTNTTRGRSKRKGWIPPRPMSPGRLRPTAPVVPSFPVGNVPNSRKLIQRDYSESLAADSPYELAALSVKEHERKMRDMRLAGPMKPSSSAAAKKGIEASIYMNSLDDASLLAETRAIEQRKEEYMTLMKTSLARDKVRARERTARDAH